MGYLHIPNLYKDQTILLFKECYALEKVHGTSANITWVNGQLTYFSGGEKHERFTALFNAEELSQKLAALSVQSITVFGEAYGGKQQGMKDIYGAELRFIAFDVRINDKWLDVPNAQQIVTSLGLEFVPWQRTATDTESLNTLRDKPSEVAERRGIANKPREGIVIRPLIEVTLNNGERVIAKHKGDAFSERATTPKIVDNAKLIVLDDAKNIANEWVTPMRLEHILDKLPQGINVEATRMVIDAMIEDVTREAVGEIIDSRDTRVAIGKRTATLFKERCKQQLQSA